MQGFTQHIPRNQCHLLEGMKCKIRFSITCDNQPHHPGKKKMLFTKKATRRWPLF